MTATRSIDNRRQLDVTIKQSMTNVDAQRHTHLQPAMASEETVQGSTMPMNKSQEVNQEEHGEEDTWDMGEDVERPPTSIVVDLDMSIPEAHAVAVDELREAKIMKIYNMPLVPGMLLPLPGYAKWMIPLSITCAFLSCLAVVGMAVFVFVVDPYNATTPVKLDSMAPTLTPTLFPDGLLPNISAKPPNADKAEWPIVPDTNESDGVSPSASTSTSVSFLSFWVAVIALTALSSLAFLVCFFCIRKQQAQRLKTVESDARTAPTMILP